MTTYKSLIIDINDIRDGEEFVIVTDPGNRPYQYHNGANRSRRRGKAIQHNYYAGWADGNSAFFPSRQLYKVQVRRLA